MAVAAPGSFLEKARQERERLAKPRQNDFTLPGYTTLRARYGPLSYARSKELAHEAYEQGFGADADLYVGAEALKDCLKCFLIEDDGEWIEWVENGEPVRYDQRLADALGFELPANPQPRDFVYCFFGGLPHADRPLMTHWFEVQAWMDDFAEDVTDEVVKGFGTAE